MHEKSAAARISASPRGHAVSLTVPFISRPKHRRLCERWSNKLNDGAGLGTWNDCDGVRIGSVSERLGVEMTARAA